MTLRHETGVHWVTQSVFTPYDWASSFDNYRCRNVANLANYNHTLGVPEDFLSLVALYLVFIPNGPNAAASLSASTTWGPRGAADNTHVAGPIAYPFAAVGSRLTAVDVQTALGVATLAPGDCIGLNVVNNAGVTLSFLHSELRYIRRPN